MTNIRSLLIVPAVLVLVAAVAAPGASAERGSDDGVANAGNSASQSTSNLGRSVAANTTQSPTTDDNPTDTDDQATAPGSKPEVEQENHHHADALVQKLQEKRHGKQNATARTKKCQAAKHGLEKKLTNLQKNAAKHKALIDKVYSEALAYQQQNNANPTGFADLVSAANNAQAQAAASVSALDSLSVNLDCNSATVATNVANFKVAAQQTRNDLLNYRNAVKAVLRSLQTAKQQEASNESTT